MLRGRAAEEAIPRDLFIGACFSNRATTIEIAMISGWGRGSSHEDTHGRLRKTVENSQRDIINRQALSTNNTGIVQ